jgi:hypothetical protein
MNRFISNILLRHTDAAVNIMPRLPGKFEPAPVLAANFSSDIENGEGTWAGRSQAFSETNTVEKKETFLNRVASTSSQNLPVTEGRHGLHLNEEVARTQEDKNPDQASEVKNIFAPAKDSQPYNEIIIDKTGNQEETELPGIKPVLTTQVTKKLTGNNTGLQVTTNRLMIDTLPNADNFTAGKEDPLHQNIAILRQKIKKQEPEKAGNMANEAKLFAPVMARPLINNMQGGTFPKASNETGEQPMSSVVKVSIGRIEVRAVAAAAPVKVNRSVLQKPNLTLDEYLKRRNGNGK